MNKMVTKKTELNDVAVGNCKDKDGQWHVVVVSFNLETGEAEITESRKVGARIDAISQFKIEAAHRGIV